VKITVSRSGGFAGLENTWSVQISTSQEKSLWLPVVEACPWDSVSDADPQPDRFVYSIRAGQRRAKLPEQEATGPWRVLIDLTVEAAGRGNPTSPPA
jgi:hypothetical protein